MSGRVCAIFGRTSHVSKNQRTIAENPHGSFPNTLEPDYSNIRMFL
jgi:hypothetical protein